MEEILYIHHSQDVIYLAIPKTHFTLPNLTLFLLLHLLAHKYQDPLLIRTHHHYPVQQEPISGHTWISMITMICKFYLWLYRILERRFLTSF